MKDQELASVTIATINTTILGNKATPTLIYLVLML